LVLDFISAWAGSTAGDFVLALWKTKQQSGWRAGVVPGERETALAIVQRRKGEMPPLLKHCGVHPVLEIRPEHILTSLIQGRVLARAPVSGVISAEDYQLVQVEAPEVPPAELRAAVRWKLRDMIDFPLEEAVIDVFEIPQSQRRAQEKKLFAIAARSSAVQRVVELISQRARGFDVIDVPELCLRNLSALLPQDAKGVALLALGEGFAQLVLTRQGVLYVTRRIEFNRRFDGDAEDNIVDGNIDAAVLALEIQRSLDYYESHYDQTPISELVLAPSDVRSRQLAAALKSETNLDISLFEPERLFEVADGVEIDMRWPGLIALGAALRTDDGEP